MPDLSHCSIHISYPGGGSARSTGELKLDDEAQKFIESKHMCGPSLSEAQKAIWVFTSGRVGGYEAVNSPSGLLWTETERTNKALRGVEDFHH